MHPTEAPAVLGTVIPAGSVGVRTHPPQHSSGHDAVETVAQARRSLCLIFGHPMTFFLGEDVS